MKNLNMKLFLYLLGGFSAIVLFVAASVQGFDLGNFLDVLRLIPIVATADGIAYFVFMAWLWRWKHLQGWLIPFPDLNGTWQGHIQTNWKDAEGNTPSPIPAILTIKQSFGRMSCVMRTAEMEVTATLKASASTETPRLGVSATPTRADRRPPCATGAHRMTARCSSISSASPFTNSNSKANTGHNVKHPEL